MTATVRSLLMEPSVWAGKLYLNSWVKGRGGTVSATDKATGMEIGQVGVASSEDVDAACNAAASAVSTWATTPPERRAEIIRYAGKLLDQHKDEVVYWLVRESGSTKFKANIDLQLTLGHFANSADFALRPARTVVIDTPDMLSYYDRVPLGAVGIIGPFNFPLVLDARSLTAALAMGNTVVLKPSLNTAVSGGIILARIFEEAGLPQGVLHVLPGGNDTGAALAQHPSIAMIAFTGSTEAGRRIGATAGATFKRVSLELGGKNPFIVLPGADLELAARAGAFGTFLHQGQICMTTGLHLVHESLADTYADRVAFFARELKVGDPWVEEVALGPIINEKQCENVMRIIRETVASGATLVEGGTHQGLFVRPTVLKNVPRQSPAFQEEIFGPVAVIASYRREEEAVELANGTGFGLSAAVYGPQAEARVIAGRLSSGMVHINDQTVMEDARVPFGGTHQSGNSSRVGGVSDLEEYTTFRWTTETRKPQPYVLPNL
jgi:benzaldehyde dehydrogenase (NAD)